MTYKTDLAQRYFPQLQPQQALRQLKALIFCHPDLMEELLSTGYRHSQKRQFFTPREVEIIQKHLGSPYPQAPT